MTFKTIISIAFFFISIVSFGQDNFDDFIKKANDNMNNMHYQDAMAQFDKAFEIKENASDSSNVAWNAVLAAICAQELKNENKTLDYYTVAINYKSTDQDAYDQLIKLAKKTKNKETEEFALRMGKQNLPGQEYRYTNKLLYFYYNKQDFEKTIETANELLTLRPNSSKTKILRAVAYYNTGKSTEAISELEAVLLQDPENMKAISQLGLIHYRVVNAEYDAIVAKYNKLAKPTRMDYADFNRNSKACAQKFNNAIPYLKKAYEAEKKNAVRVALFNAYIRLENKTEADKYRE